MSWRPQVFIHSPLMRNYFLGQGHSQSACLRHGKSPGVPCLSCELDAVFAAAYSGDRAPLSPTDFLYSWWTFADSLAGYRQQDAHEFYLSALSGLAGVQPNTGVGSCRGRGLVPLVDAVFGGVLRSDVTCSVCGHTSTAYDPFLDISLDMVQGHGAGFGAANPSVPRCAQGAVGHATLQGCLRHFVTPERLSAGEAWVCSACKQQQPAVKQLSIRRLPPVLALHVKREEELWPPFRPCPVQTKLHFPLSLDLAPYTTPAILRERCGFQRFPCEPALGDLGGLNDTVSCRYRLFAVISHKGDLSGGHYVVFVRPGGAAGGSWYQCDDAWVTAVSVEDVTACQAYMLFYSDEAS
ncbi:hypothetical protein VOLCADRAFT_67026 [Volvox carteri f. nagariensis]|uniref:USP domain-containing protein n=1 Tax=Volvox carteri f. nagariensis TaxID=3068 RepID=D8UD04_VOLCA|nr:uncharacterized protein VOLCADRAFT_67026 [Volvox carteri f. nagariensis]EFJ42481.1 hypothetical protein VOLCADRAFT_67026 [Volvox carteri f. nagariensis]|eukprot:XP_002956544.1 hypothetical protein VOLCADRAFT_67026 [Volvox carteri f. nagariensis]